MTVRLGRACVAASCALLAAPAAASGHSIVRQSNGETSYLSSDAVSLNTLEVTASGGEIRLSDPTVDGGIDPGICRPGRTDDNGYVTEVFCSRAGIARVRVELGEREDRMTSTLDLPILGLGGGGADQLATGAPNDALVGNEGNDTLDGGAGNDQLNGGDGDDIVRGGPGNDVLQAGPGGDEVDAGSGDDDVRARDGLVDRVSCGVGADKVDADPDDVVGADCEAVTRGTTPAPPPGGPGTPPGPDPTPGPTPDPGPGSGPGSGGPGTTPPPGSTRGDKTPPRLQVGGPTTQRVRRDGVVRVLATSSERGTMAASGALDVSGISLPLTSRVVRVPTAGGGVTLIAKLSREQLRQVRRALQRRRRVSVRLSVVATDVAGNSATRRAPTVRLRL